MKNKLIALTILGLATQLMSVNSEAQRRGGFDRGDYRYSNPGSQLDSQFRNFQSDFLTTVEFGQFIVLNSASRWQVQEATRDCNDSIPNWLWANESFKRGDMRNAVAMRVWCAQGAGGHIYMFGQVKFNLKERYEVESGTKRVLELEGIRSRGACNYLSDNFYNLGALNKHSYPALKSMNLSSRCESGWDGYTLVMDLDYTVINKEKKSHRYYDGN